MCVCVCVRPVGPVLLPGHTHLVVGLQVSRRRNCFSSDPDTVAHHKVFNLFTLHFLVLFWSLFFFRPKFIFYTLRTLWFSLGVKSKGERDETEVSNRPSKAARWGGEGPIVPPPPPTPTTLSFSVFLSTSAHSHPGWGWWWWPFLGVMGNGGRGTGRGGRTAAEASFNLGQQRDGTYASLSLSPWTVGPQRAGLGERGRPRWVSVAENSDQALRARAEVLFRRETGEEKVQYWQLSLYKAAMFFICAPEAP